MVWLVYEDKVGEGSGASSSIRDNVVFMQHFSFRKGFLTYRAEVKLRGCEGSVKVI